MEIFKKASKKKLRFSTNRGSLPVEQLWDLPKEEIRQLVIKAREAAKKSFPLFAVRRVKSTVP